jgi:competence protein ComFC
MASFTPRMIMGRWKKGYALDLHTLSSTPIGYNEFGHLQFDNHYSDVGKLLYNLKSKSDVTSVDEIVKAVAKFMEIWNPPADVIVPIPPSNKRTVQPVIIMAEAISKNLGIPMIDCVKRKREIPQLKNVFDSDERAKLLEDLHEIDTSEIQGKNILIFDDLFRSGATMNAITTELYDTGQISDIFALTITRTRSNQ